MKETGIRGHHLDYLLQIDRAHMMYEQAGYPPHEAKRIAEAEVRNWMKDILWSMSSMGEQDPTNKDYYLDVVGEDKTRIPGIAQSFTTALLGIYHMSQRDVEIHSDKDGICQACAVGNHCHEDTYEFEMQYMRDVVRYAKQLELPYKITQQGNIQMCSDDLRTVLRTMNEAETTFTYANENII